MRRPPLALLAVLALAGCRSVSVGYNNVLSVNAVQFNLAADPASLNPLFLHPDAASVEQQVARLAFEPFIDLDEHGRPVPALLDRIPTLANGGLSADGRTITYHLRRVRWSDGKPVTSDDVLYTLHAILDPKNPVRSHEGYDLIDRAAAPNAQTVVFHLKRAWAPAVMTYFSYGTSPQFVLPAHILRAQEPLAQGPFNAAPSASTQALASSGSAIAASPPATSGSEVRFETTHGTPAHSACAAAYPKPSYREGTAATKALRFPDVADEVKNTWLTKIRSCSPLPHAT